MAKQIVITVPHSLATEEVRRRLDRHTDWAKRRLEKDNIKIAIEDWHGNARGFAARALGQNVSGSLDIGEDALRLTAALPLTLGLFSPVLEAAARHYAAELLA
ncbi:polyhydroxyalkanoic acid system family protein [Methylobacterium dankookense]|uniref:Polyhydroxyalkanoic acid system protein n=1 Tax=Methylobacterium dankookense TaxID=560405 RepID=A0A564FQN5_9HYPH|nr:polyhydroxyalkanoic acid system family protein [Methylobacterium dankookense]GJD58110.1 hypothetical protein IFDJLNFL_4025 [Methylobacterium dankookense]VUF10465.1 hypothetical protein MTDSW087_00132 [Methylobacterium dankookense]